MECDIEDGLGEDKENSNFVITEVSGDLFQSPKSHSLCHCVSRDFRLGKGIAKLFRDKFGRVEELRRSGAGVRGVAVLRDGGRFIYNLVTKEVYSDKPTYETLRQSLEKMKEHAEENNVTHINMPRHAGICCRHSAFLQKIKEMVPILKTSSYFMLKTNNY